ncbi:MAG: 1,4-dihydroxy-6-naphthoate synthase [Planctomycetota bacterium]|jgi:1,4-dihydroxy-6-naphthoate synthase
MSTLQLGLSTCPNDTYLFHGLLTGRSDPHGLDFEFFLGDVEELNQRLAAGDFHLAKGSFAAALGLGAERVVMPTGAALGFGVGPLLLASASAADASKEPRVLCPGAGTTAHLLYRLFHSGEGHISHAVFSEIMPALIAGDADLGVCIHEGRFTYAEHGLRCIEDLGQRWEQETSLALPLGGLFARRDLDPSLLQRLQAALFDSLAYAHAHRAETLESMSLHAQEFSVDVLFQHVDLYVNEWTRDLGAQGRVCLEELGRRARSTGLIASDAAALEVWSPPS